MNKVKCQNYITFTIVLYQSESLLSSKSYISMSPNTSLNIVHIFSENSYDQMGIVAKMSQGEKACQIFATISSITSSVRPCISSDESNVLEMDNENFNALNLSLKEHVLGLIQYVPYQDNRSSFPYVLGALLGMIHHHIGIPFHTRHNSYVKG